MIKEAPKIMVKLEFKSTSFLKQCKLLTKCVHALNYRAEANKVGEARQEPNHSPFLPPPVGRISFTMNPLKLFQQMIGPALRRKIYCYCCLMLCLFLCVMLAPLVIGNLISALINKMLGLT